MDNTFPNVPFEQACEDLGTILGVAHRNGIRFTRDVGSEMQASSISPINITDHYEIMDLDTITTRGLDGTGAYKNRMYSDYFCGLNLLLQMSLAPDCITHPGNQHVFLSEYPRNYVKAMGIDKANRQAYINYIKKEFKRTMTKENQDWARYVTDLLDAMELMF